MERFDKIVEKIYSEDKRTPLFLSKADIELRKQEYGRAVDILSEGINYYPNFAPAYLLLGKALALTGSFDLALENVKKGSDIINSKKTYDYYRDEIEKIQRRTQPQTTEETYREKDLHTPKKEQESEAKLEPRPLPVDNNIVNLVSELSESEIIYSEEPSKIKRTHGNGEIISETLAKIYITQGELKEAIKVYRKLKSRYPEKVDYFDKRIKELNIKYNV